MMPLSQLGRSTALVSALLMITSAAWACPENLKNYKTNYLRGLDICAVRDRYENVLSKLRAQNVKLPERLANVMAPRFINLPDWEKRVDDSPLAALMIYEPKPLTWNEWEKGVRVVDKKAEKNFKKQKSPTLSLKWLRHLHGITLEKLLDSAGDFRTGHEVGMALAEPFALTREQIAGVRSVEYASLLAKEKRLVSFVPTQCLEQRDVNFQTSFQSRKGEPVNLSEWPEIPESQFFEAKDGTQRQCGYIVYSPPDEILPQLHQWLYYLNTHVSTWGAVQPAGDPIFVAARAQRWLIAIHPYIRGNGRMSRFVMDLLLRSVGLPSPILKDMNADVYLSEEQWAQEVGDGILRTLNAFEQCAQNPTESGCTMIPQFEKGVSLWKH